MDPGYAGYDKFAWLDLQTFWRKKKTEVLCIAHAILFVRDSVVVLYWFNKAEVLKYAGDHCEPLYL